MEYITEGSSPVSYSETKFAGTSINSAAYLLALSQTGIQFIKIKYKWSQLCESEFGEW